MTFEFRGVKLDTEKPIYVYGYTIIDSWVPYRVGDHCFHDRFHDHDVEKPSAKQFYVNQMTFTFDSNLGIPVLSNVSVITKRRNDSIHSIKLCGFGQTPKEAKRMWENLQAEAVVNVMGKT